MSKLIFSRQLINYMMVGGFATIIDAAIFVLLVYTFNYDYRLALCGGFVVGVMINFALCNKFIFDRGKISLRRACVKHYVASLTGLALNQVGMIILISGFEFQKLLVARILVAGCTFIINFALIKRFVFNRF